MELLVQTDSPELMPSRAHWNDAGLDLRMSEPEPVEIGPGEIKQVGTGVRVAIPDGYVGLVVPRSGLAFKHGISLVNAPGVIDSGYRGEIRLALVNLGAASLALNPGERVAQLLVSPIMLCDPVVSEVLPEAERGVAGFGSSGLT